MRTPKVRLYIRVRSAGGKYTFHDPVWNKNRTLRAAYALVNRQPEYHPEGVYYLRYLHGTKRIWHAVGLDADAALVACQNKEHDLWAVRLGRLAEPSPQPVFKLGLGAAIESYPAEIRRSRSAKTIAACNRILGVFGSRLPGRSLDSISRADLLDHRATLQQEAQSADNLQPHNEDQFLPALARNHGFAKAGRQADLR